MRSLSEMLIAIAVSLLVLSAIYAARDAFLSKDSPPRVPSEGPTFLTLPPHEVKEVPDDTAAFGPPEPPAEPAVALPAVPPTPALENAGGVRALRL
jgi:hypothetical protein